MPATAPSPVVSVSPVVLSAPERGVDLPVRVSAPATGDRLPVLLFAHGYGWSLDGYAPLVDHWAASGFVVLQTTHLDSRRLGLTQDDARYDDIWRFRIADLRRMLDELDVLEAAVPGLAGRVDRDRVAVAGHSFGGQTAGSLLGARVVGPTAPPARTSPIRGSGRASCSRPRAPAATTFRRSRRSTSRS